MTNSQKRKPHQNSSRGSRGVTCGWADGGTDRNNKAVAFANFANAPIKGRNFEGLWLRGRYEVKDRYPASTTILMHIVCLSHLASYPPCLPPYISHDNPPHFPTFLPVQLHTVSNITPLQHANEPAKICAICNWNSLNSKQFKTNAIALSVSLCGRRITLTEEIYQ